MGAAVLEEPVKDHVHYSFECGRDGACGGDDDGTDGAGMHVVGDRPNGDLLLTAARLGFLSKLSPQQTPEAWAIFQEMNNLVADEADQLQLELCGRGWPGAPADHMRT